MQNEQVKQCCEKMWGILCQIPDIEIVSKLDLECEVKVFKHDPLEKIHCYYKCQNRLWTQNYILNFLVEKKVNMVDGSIHIIYKNGHMMWYSVQKGLQKIIQELNDNYILETKVKCFLDLGGDVQLQIKNANVYIELSMLPGSITKFIIPPVVHFVTPNKEEILLSFQIMQILQCIV